MNVRGVAVRYQHYWGMIRAINSCCDRCHSLGKVFLSPCMPLMTFMKKMMMSSKISKCNIVVSRCIFLFIDVFLKLSVCLSDNAFWFANHVVYKRSHVAVSTVVFSSWVESVQYLQIQMLFQFHTFVLHSRSESLISFFFCANPNTAHPAVTRKPHES